MKKDDKKTVCFHVGRGGRFYNAGCRTYVGRYNLQELIIRKDSYLYYYPENYFELLGLDNADLLDECMVKDDYSEYTRVTGREVGKPALFDYNGNLMLSNNDMNNLTGSLDWDGNYDTDIVMYLEDCDEHEIKLIIESRDIETLKDFGEIKGFSALEMRFMDEFNKWSDLVDCEPGFYIEENYIETDEEDYHGKEIDGVYYTIA